MEWYEDRSIYPCIVHDPDTETIYLVDNYVSGKARAGLYYKGYWQVAIQNIHKFHLLVTLKEIETIAPERLV